MVMVQPCSRGHTGKLHAAGQYIQPHMQHACSMRTQAPCRLVRFCPQSMHAWGPVAALRHCVQRVAMATWSAAGARHALSPYSTRVQQGWVGSSRQALEQLVGPSRKPCGARTNSASEPSAKPTASSSAVVMPEVPASASDSEIIAAWDQALIRLRDIALEVGSLNRKARMTEVRAHMASLEARLKPEQAEELGLRLIAQRRADVAVRKSQLQEALAGGGSGPTIVVDCSFAEDHCRPGLERRSLVKQVEWAVAFNRRSGAPLALHATGWVGEVATFGTYIGADAWPLVRQPGRVLDIYPLDKVVVMSPDAEEPLTQLEGDKIYVIGGIVDRTVKKGVTHSFAGEHGLTTRRLPIAEYAEALGFVPGVRTSPVLNVSDVAIALMELHRSGDWVRALDCVIPHRKRRPQQPRRKRVRPTALASTFEPGSMTSSFASGSSESEDGEEVEEVEQGPVAAHSGPKSG